METQSEAAGLYISIPFCRHKCTFCNFASGVGSGEDQARYVDSLCEEIAAAEQIAVEMGAALRRRVDSVYLGGGTPSLLSAEQMRRLFASIRDVFDIQAGAEITLEAAPGQIEDAALQAALARGVNRVSLGVQSFVQCECSAVGRTHTRESCLREFQRLRAAGIVNLGADLIAGLPYQTEASWRESLRIAAEAEVDHISIYLLEIDEDSRLGREVLLGGQRFHAGHIVDEALSARLYEIACEELPRAGLAQYEISNFARPGFTSRHNRKYWQRTPYMGFGLDAHSMLLTGGGRAVRWSNADELATYSGAGSPRERTPVGDREAFEETVFLALRMNEGLAAVALECFPGAWVADFASAAGEMVRAGCMTYSQQRWRLTLRGRLVSSEVFGELLAGVPAPA